MISNILYRHNFIYSFTNILLHSDIMICYFSLMNSISCKIQYILHDSYSVYYYYENVCKARNASSQATCSAFFLILCNPFPKFINTLPCKHIY